MSTDQTEYDLFVSYARLDNREGWIKAYVDRLAEEFRIFTGGRELRYFWDTERIPDFAHWEAEIFNKGIARSKLFLAFLSPNYFASEVCRREWRAWVEREIGLHIFTEGASPIYIVEIPAMFGKPLPPEHETARQVAELCNLPLPHDVFVREAETLVRQFRRRQLHAVQPFYNRGLKALQEADLRQQLQSLAQSVDERVDQLDRAAASESTVPPYNIRFTGRVDELVDLRGMLKDNHTGVVAGVHGLGGIGKTELAFTFAHAYASVYAGGRYYVRCEGQTTLASAFTNLEKDPFHDEVSDAERNDIQKNFNAVYRCLKKRLAEKGPVLLVLDNVSDPALLHPEQTGQLTTLGPNLHLLATTRLPQAIGIKTLMLGEMQRDEALALLEKFRPFTAAADRAAAETMVTKLGGFALAVELVAGRMLAKPSATYAGVLNELGLDKLEDFAADPDVKLMRHSHEQRLRKVLQPTLAELPAEAKCLIQYAALLPPDRVTFPWLKTLVVADFPLLGQRCRDGSDPWYELVRSLFRRSIFTGVHGNEVPTTARLHRLIGDYLRETLPNGCSGKLGAFIVQRTYEVSESQSAPEDWELDALVDTIPHWLQRQQDQQVAQQGTFLSDKVTTYRNLPQAQSLLHATHACLKFMAESVPANAAWQRDLYVSYIKLGDLATAQGNLPEAQRLFGESLRIAQRLAESDSWDSLPACHSQDDPTVDRLEASPTGNPVWQRDLYVSYIRLGDLATAQGNLPGAQRLFGESLRIAQRLAESDPWDSLPACHSQDAPTVDRLEASPTGNAVWQRDLSVSLIKLGKLAAAQGNLLEAQRLFGESLVIRQRLAGSDPANAQWQYDVGISNEGLGDVARAQGDLAKAHTHYSAKRNVIERLAESDPANAAWQRDLSISLNRLGELAKAQGNLPEAQRLLGEDLRIAQRLAESDPANAVWQRDLSVSLNRLGNLAKSQGNLPEAQRLLGDCHRTLQRLAESDPANAEWQFDLGISNEGLGDVASAQGDLAKAHTHYSAKRAIIKRLAESDPANAAWQRDLSVSFSKLGDLATAQGNLPEAQRLFGEDLRIAQRLAESDPANAEWQRDLAGAWQGVASVATTDELTLHYQRQCLQVLENMRQREMHFDVNTLEVYEQLLESLSRREPCPVTTRIPAQQPLHVAPVATSQEQTWDWHEAVPRLLQSGDFQAVLDMLQPIVFRGTAAKLNPDASLDSRIAFLHALMLKQDVDSLQTHLRSFPEQDDPRIKHIRAALVDWQRNLTFLQRFFGFRPPPLSPPPLDYSPTQP